MLVILMCVATVSTAFINGLRNDQLKWHLAMNINPSNKTVIDYCRSLRNTSGLGTPETAFTEDYIDTRALQKEAGYVAIVLHWNSFPDRVKVFELKLSNISLLEQFENSEESNISIGDSCWQQDGERKCLNLTLNYMRHIFGSRIVIQSEQSYLGLVNNKRCDPINCTWADQTCSRDVIFNPDFSGNCSKSDNLPDNHSYAVYVAKLGAEMDVFRDQLFLSLPISIGKDYFKYLIRLTFANLK